MRLIAQCDAAIVHNPAPQAAERDPNGAKNVVFFGRPGVFALVGLPGS